MVAQDVGAVGGRGVWKHSDTGQLGGRGLHGDRIGRYEGNIGHKERKYTWKISSILKSSVLFVVREHSIEQWRNIRVIFIIHVNHIVLDWILRHHVSQLLSEEFPILSGVQLSGIYVGVGFDIFLHFIWKIFNGDVIHHDQYNKSVTTFNSLKVSQLEFLLTPARIQILSENKRAKSPFVNKKGHLRTDEENFSKRIDLKWQLCQTLMPIPLLVH